MSEWWRPHPYQKEAMKFMLGHGAGALLQDPGLGKTSETYGAFNVLKKRGLIERMLVIAPLRAATSTWPREQAKWNDFHKLNVHVLHGRDKEKLLRQPHDVSVINPDIAAMRWLLGSKRDVPVLDAAGNPVLDKKGRPRTREVRVPGAAEKAGVWWDMLVVDESTRFKNQSSKRFKVLRPHLGRFRRRYILTGTPAPNSLLDLFGQIYILDLGNALGRFVTHYRNEFFDRTGYGGFTWKPRPKAEQRVYEKLRPLVLRMRAEDYLDLPPLIKNTVDVELPDKARRAYDQMEQELIVMLDGELVTAANVATAVGKCRQIANGGIYTGEGKWKHVHDAKTEATAELVEELGGKPVMVAFEYHHDLDRLRRAFKEAPYLGGGVGTRQAREIEDRWNAGLLPVLLVQPQSVSHGLNLQGVGAAIVFYGLTWNLEDYDQLIRRVWRQGQRERVVVHHLVARRTVDEAVMRALARKARTQGALLDALRSTLREKTARNVRSR